MTTSALSKEFEFYVSNQEEMVSKYDGKVIALKNRKVLGAHDDDLTALTDHVQLAKVATHHDVRLQRGQ